MANRRLRWGNARDYTALADVMFDAVRNGDSQYTEQQREAWVPAPRSGPEWDDRLARQDVILAENDAGVVGFMTLADGGYVDFAYIRPSAQRTGLFRHLLDAIESRARDKGVTQLWVHASLMAEPAFAALGFTVRRKEEVSIGEQRFERFEMEKAL